MDFTGLQEPWGELLRWLTYCWINKPTPTSLRDAPGSRRVTFPAPATIRLRHKAARSVIEWLHGQGVTEMREIDEDHVVDLIAHMRAEKMSPEYISGHIEVLVSWQALESELPDSLRLAEDLEIETVKLRSRTGENKTRRIREKTIAPLIWWSQKFVDDFSEDLFALLQFVTVPVGKVNRTQSKASQSRAFLLGFVDEHGGLPTREAIPDEHAVTYLSWLSGIDAVNLGSTLRTFDAGATGNPVDCPVSIPGRELDEYLIPFAQYYDLVAYKKETWPKLARMMQAACLIIVAYLTGMRPEEVRRLRPGCVSEVTLPGGGVRYLIQGSVTKLQKEADGLAAGSREEVEALWATIALAARAVRVAEQLRASYSPESPWLFPSVETGDLISSGRAAQNINEFIDVINQRCASTENRALLIPPDTHGPISLRRFRRTLAWHIRNQPQGDVALGIQYQHVGTVIGSGYASVGSTGWSELLDEEGRDTRKKVIQHLSEQLLEGAGISGPAASRVAAAAQEFTTERAAYMEGSDLRTLLNAPGMQIFDNKAGLVLCAFNPDWARCDPAAAQSSATASPNLLNCQTGCANRATTDEQAEEMADRADQLRREANLAPTPLANRLLQEAAALEERVEQHKRERVIPTVPILEEMTPNE